MPDYSEAIEAAARAMSAHWNDMHTNMSLDRQRMLAIHALNAAAPIIERQVRERAVIDAQSALSGALHRLTLLGRGDSDAYRAVRDYGGDIIAAIATPAPIPPTSEDQCETCGRILDCSGNCSKGCAQ